MSHLIGSVLRGVASRLERARFDPRYAWRDQAHPYQVPPWEQRRHRDRSTWLLMGGRGIGKTRTGSETVREWAEAGQGPIAIIGATSRDTRQVMIEGHAGILAVSPPGFRPEYFPSKLELVWPNGVIGYVYTAEEPERLRGPAVNRAWWDEVAASRYITKTLDNLWFALRESPDPRIVMTTTPRPRKAFIAIHDDEDTVVVGAPTEANRKNLSAKALDKLRRRYEGTRVGAQELLGQLLRDIPGQLFTLDLIQAGWVLPEHVPQLRRVVVAVDPAGSRSTTAADTGIIVAGSGPPPEQVRSLHPVHGYVLRDASGHLSPRGWGRRAVAAYKAFGADCIVAEVNYGGEMVVEVIRSIDPLVPVKVVNATRGKVIRAGPIASLYEQGIVHHVRPAQSPLASPGLEALEEQLTRLGVKASEDADDEEDEDGDGRLDRADAAVWALKELLLGEREPDLTQLISRAGSRKRRAA